MVFESISQALTNGQLPVKIAMASVLVASFLFLRRKETEGAMGGYALLGLFLVVRDVAFALFPVPDLFRSSDSLIFAGLLYLRAAPFGARWSLWAPAAAALSAAAILGCNAFLDFLPPSSSEALRAVSFFPVAAAALIPLSRREHADTTGRELCLRSWIPLAVGSVGYLVAGAAFGPESGVFQGAAAPLFYGVILSIAFFFIDIEQRDLISAVEYYEESIDSLYELLLSAGSAMKAEFSLQDVLDKMLRSFVARAGADGGILALADEFDDAVSIRALHGDYPPPFKLPESLPRDRERVAAFVRRARFKLGEGVLGEAARSGQHCFLPQGGDSLPDNGEEEWLQPGALIVAPLVVEKRIIGVVSVAKAAPGSFSERDFERCKLLADFGSIAVANSFTFLEAAERSDIEREAAIAADVQRTIVPKKLPEVPRLEFGVFSSPARGVCSDYYDIIRTKPGTAIVAVGDVAGKGVAASLVMVMIQAILRLITASAKDASTLLQWVNRGLSGRVDLDHYATLGLIIADAATGTLDFANAGHQPLIVYRADADAIETVEAKSVPIGVERTSAFPAKRLAMRPGDILVMYTDGIIEAMNEQGKQYGRRNLGNAIQRSHALAAQTIAESVRDDLAAFAGRSRQHDDQTILVMKAMSR